MTKPAGTPLAPRTSWALLRDRTFGTYFVGNLVSNCGTWLQNIAAAVVVYRLTGSTLMVGSVSIVQFASSMVLSPWAGAVSDRMDRRRLLMLGQVLAFCAAAGLAVWTALVGVEGLPGPWPILGAALVIGVGFAVSVPTMQALVPALVDDEDLDQAVALNSVTFNLARAVGPAIGAVTLAALGAAAAFGLNAASYLVLILALLVIRPRHIQRRTGAGDGSVREGLRYVRRAPALVVLLTGVAALGFGMDPVTTLTPAMADLLGGGDPLVGWLVSAFGAGAAAMALAVARVRRRVPLGRLGVMGLVILAAGLFGFASAPEAAVAIAALAVAGTGFLLSVTALTTEIQQRVDEHVRGRVMALWGVAFLGSRPLAALVDGAVADVVGPRTAAALAGAITAGVAWWLASARRRHSLDDAPSALASQTPGESTDATTPPVTS